MRGQGTLQLAHQHNAIAHRQQDILDLLIAANSFVERVVKICRAVVLRVEHTAVAQDVVEDDQAARPGQF